MNDIARMQPANARSADGRGLGFRPLYRQVRDVLVRRIAERVWQPGDALPSEPEIAADLGVSQGTVRKALDEMEVENLVVRRQGRGTYVARHDEARILFQFFKLVPDAGPAQFPESRIIDVRVRDADARTAQVLALRAGARTVRIERVRSVAGQLCVFEEIVLPRALYPGIERLDLPNNLYELYRSKFGVTIVRASEHLKGTAATRREAAHIGVKTGTPLLSIDRTAISIDGRPVEWRLSLCLTECIHYLSDLR